MSRFKKSIHSSTAAELCSGKKSMRHPGTKSGLRLALLLIALSAASDLHAQRTNANLTVCNKGTVAVNVVVVERSLAINLIRVLQVDGWAIVEPGACRQVYHETEDGNIERAQPAYIGIGFGDAKHRLVTGTVDPVPDFGRSLFDKILTRSDLK